jgi:hypothetical protein
VLAAPAGAVLISVGDAHDVHRVVRPWAIAVPAMVRSAGDGGVTTARRQR